MKKVISLAIISLIGLLLGSGITFYGLIIGDSGRHSPDNCTKTVRGEVAGYDYITAPNDLSEIRPVDSFENIMATESKHYTEIKKASGKYASGCLYLYHFPYLYVL